MNRLVLAILVLSFAIPLASAHGKESNLGHLSVNVHDLAPGQIDTYNLVAEESEGVAMDTGSDLKAGWIFTLYGGVQGNGSVRLNLTHGTTLEDHWDWAPGAINSNSTRLQFGGQHELEVRNVGNRTVRYAFYFDQSCNCAYKVIPMPQGFVLFNYDLPAGRNVKLEFPTIDGWDVRAKVALLRNDAGHWPQDFTIITQGEQKGKGWLNLTWKTPSKDRYFVFVDAPQGVHYNETGAPVPVELTPQLEVGSSKAPAPSFVSWVGVLGAVAGAFARRWGRA